MKARRRIDKIEASLSTVESVLLWMAEAHRHTTTAYVPALLADAPSVTPPDGILDRIDATFDAGRRVDERTAAIMKAKRRAARNAIFAVRDRRPRGAERRSRAGPGSLQPRPCQAAGRRSGSPASARRTRPDMA
jgi:hypothetical protein